MPEIKNGQMLGERKRAPRSPCRGKAAATSGHMEKRWNYITFDG
jgi:hypothetical protein